MNKVYVGHADKILNLKISSSMDHFRSKRMAGNRMSLMDRQNLYAKPRSHSEGASPNRSRSVSPAKR